MGDATTLGRGRLRILDRSNITLHLKISLIVGYSLLAFNGFTLTLYPLERYEPSFYTHLPPTYWIISIAIFMGCSFLLLHILDMKAIYKSLLFLLITLNNFLILFSPFICGVFLMSGGDSPTYAGMAQDIIQYQDIDFHTIFYPFIPILIGFLSIISKITYLDSVIVLAPLFSLLFPICMYILSKNILDDPMIHVLSFLLGSTLFLSGIFPVNSTTTVFGLSLLTLPILLISIIIKERNEGISYAIMVITVLFSYVMYHPLTGFIIFFSIIILFVTRLYLKQKINYDLYAIFPTAFAGYIFLITVVWKRPMGFVRDFLDSFMDYSEKGGYRVDIGQNLEHLGFDFYDTISLAIKMFGHQALLLLFIFMFVFFILTGYTKKFTAKDYWIQLIYSWVFVAVILLILQIVKPLFIISFYRFLYCAILFAPLISAVVIVDLIKVSHKIIAILLILCFLFTCGIFTAYASPYISQANPQVTFSDSAGAMWIIENEKVDSCVMGYFGSSITKRITSGFLPYRDYLKLKNYGAIGDHLDYSDSLATDRLDLNTNTLVVITDYDLIVYTGVYHNIGRLNMDDLKIFNSDPFVSCVYKNGGYTLYEISSH